MATRSQDNNNVVSKVIDFLERNNALELDQVPWTSYTDSDDIAGVDYNELMSDPRGESREKSWNAPEDFAREVNDILSRARESVAPSGFSEGAERIVTPTDTRWDGNPPIFRGFDK